jgi:hypothetical protein
MRALGEPERAGGQHAAADRNREQEQKLGCRLGRRFRDAFLPSQCMAPLMTQQTAMALSTGAKCGRSERAVEMNGARPPKAKIATARPLAAMAETLIRSFATSVSRDSLSASDLEREPSGRQCAQDIPAMRSPEPVAGLTAP